MFKQTQRWTLTIFMILFSCVLTAKAAIMQVDSNGQLTGAKGILVSGQLYDVAFKDGRFNDLFPNGYLPFISNSTQATSFANALLGQVFLDGADGLFDSNPALTFGCSVATCEVWIPYQNYRYNPGNAQIFYANNTSNLDTVLSRTAPKYHNTGVHTNQVYATFSASAVAAVPEPDQTIMLLIGLILVAHSYLRRKHL